MSVGQAKVFKDQSFKLSELYSCYKVKWLQVLPPADCCVTKWHVQSQTLRPKEGFIQVLKPAAKWQTMSFILQILSSEDGAFCSPYAHTLTPQSDTRNRTLSLQGIKQYQHAYCLGNSQLNLQTTAATDRTENELWTSRWCSTLQWNFYSQLSFYLKTNFKYDCFSCNCFLK